MSRFIHSGLVRLVFTLGLITFGPGWAFAQLGCLGGEPQEIKQPSLVELAKLYQDLELPLPPNGAKLVRFNFGEEIDRYFSIKITRFDFGLAFPRQIGTKVEWHYWLGIEEPDQRYIRWKDSKIYDEPPKPEEVLQSLGLRRISGDLLELQPDYYELILAIHCHFLGYDELARFFYWRCNRSATQPYDRMLVNTAWNYWVTEITNDGRDRLVVLRNLKKIIGKHEFYKINGCLDENGRIDPRYDMVYKSHQVLLDRLDLIVKTVPPEAGTLEALIGELVDCPRGDQNPYPFPKWNQDEKGMILWDRPTQIQNRKKWYAGDQSNEIKKKVYRMGFEAIPGLISHLDDFRLTRAPIQMNSGFSSGGPPDTIDSSGFFTVNIDIHEVLAAYLDMPIPSRFEETRTSKKEYLAAWNEIKNRNELEYAFQRLEKGEWGSPFVSYLLARFPEKIEEFYLRIIQKKIENDSIDQIIYALIDGNRSKEQKIKLLQIGVNSPDWKIQKLALMGLIEVDPSSFDRCFLEMAGKLPKVTEDKNSWEPVVELVSLGLTSEDAKVRRKVLEISKALPPIAKDDLIGSFSNRNLYLNKKATLLLFELFLKCEDETDFKKGNYSDIDLSYPGLKTAKIKDISAYYYIDMKNMDFKFNGNKTANEWEWLRTFVLDDIARQLESEGGK